VDRAGLVEVNELVEVSPLDRALLEREVLVGPKVLHPQLLGPGLLLRRLAVEEDHVRLDARLVEDSRGQPKQRVDIVTCLSFMHQSE